MPLPRSCWTPSCRGRTKLARWQMQMRRAGRTGVERARLQVYIQVEGCSQRKEGGGELHTSDTRKQSTGTPGVTRARKPVRRRALPASTRGQKRAHGWRDSCKKEREAERGVGFSVRIAHREAKRREAYRSGTPTPYRATARAPVCRSSPAEYPFWHRTEGSAGRKQIRDPSS